MPESRLSEDENRRFKYYFYEGLRLKDNRLYDQAIETFKLCLAIDSLDAGANSEIAMLYSAIGLGDEAIHSMETAVQADPRNWWYGTNLVNMLSQQKKWDEAIAVASRIQKEFPNKPEIYSVLASLYKETKNYGKSIAAYDRLENITGIDQSISFEKFRLYVLEGKWKKGISEIDKLVQKYPTESRFKVLRGDIFMEQKMPEKAFAIYQDVLKNDPQSPYVYVSLSEYYKSVNQDEKAIESIVSALKNDQLDVETKMEIMGQYVDKIIQDSTKLMETESLFKLLVERYPFEEQVHSYYSVYLQYRQRIPEAISELETMTGINPENEQTWLRLIQMNFAGQKPEQALKATEQAIGKLPGQSMWYFYRGIAHFQLADFKMALDDYRKGLELASADQAALKSDLYAQLADTYFKLEQKDSAFANYENALAANPKNIMVMNNYAYYLSLEKQELKKAERMSARTVEIEPGNSTYLDTYAWILYQQGNYSLAKFYIERAVDSLKRGEDHGVILEHYGDILWMNGKTDKKDDDKALELWQRSYEAGNKTDELKKKIESKGWNRE
ncbi:MAG TPA: tetratricopeptide repeat protein [Paludibacter sp.]|nr:tetratricopeptide repeat protein [Paludibacter sp.]